MRYVIVALFGLFLGAAAAGIALYYNPLTARETPSTSSADRSLHYGLPEDALRFIAGERVMLPHWPHGASSFWEETINGSALLAVVLRDDGGVPTAVATRLISASSDTDLLLKGALASDYWLVTFPDEGTLFVRADTNLWPFLRDTLIPVWYLGRPWSGPTDVHPTAGPRADGAGALLGGTGRFAGVAGTAVESYRLTEFDRTSAQIAASGELDLDGLDPVVASGE